MATTTNLGLTIPTVGADDDTWGTINNAVHTGVDAVFAAAGSGTSVGVKVGTGKTLNALDGTVVLGDAGLTIKDTADPTKIAAFQCSGITAGQTRTYTFPDASGTLLYSGGAVAGSSLTSSGLTSGRIPLVSTAGLLADSSLFTYSISNKEFSFVGAGSGTITGAPNLNWNGGSGSTVALQLNASNGLDFWANNGSWAVAATMSAAGNFNFNTVTATGTITPSQTAGIVGTTTNNDANAGSVGQLITSTVTGVSLTTLTQTNATSISLTAGDWDVWLSTLFAGDATTTVTRLLASISTTSATLDTSVGRVGDVEMQSYAVFASGSPTVNVQPVRLSLSGTTTIYAVCFAQFLTSTCTVSAVLQARRRR